MADRKQIQFDLEDRGLSPRFAHALAGRLDKVVDRLHPEIYDAVLTGAALAYDEHGRALDAMRKSSNDLEEIQTLLAAFGDELQKLDEALETLAAYTLRMRSQSTTRATLLH